MHLPANILEKESALIDITISKHPFTHCTLSHRVQWTNNLAMHQKNGVIGKLINLEYANTLVIGCKEEQSQEKEKKRNEYTYTYT